MDRRAGIGDDRGAIQFGGIHLKTLHQRLGVLGLVSIGPDLVRQAFGFDDQFVVFGAATLEEFQRAQANPPAEEDDQHHDSEADGSFFLCAIVGHGDQLGAGVTVAGEPGVISTVRSPTLMVRVVVLLPLSIFGGEGDF